MPYIIEALKTMKRFDLHPNNERIILRQIKPQMEMLIIMNDDIDYDVWNDVYELFYFRGNKIIIKWLATEEEIEAVDNFYYIRSNLKKAWHWYKSQVYIEAKKQQEGPDEDQRYQLRKLPNNIWLLTDKEYLITIRWSHRQFNDTQEVVELEDISQENIRHIPTVLREMADWLVDNHPNKIY